MNILEMILFNICLVCFILFNFLITFIYGECSGKMKRGYIHRGHVEVRGQFGESVFSFQHVAPRYELRSAQQQGPLPARPSH